MESPDPNRERDARLLTYYVWKDIARRAPGIPTALLYEIAMRTASDVPDLGDPVAGMEWHINHVIALARAALDSQRRAAVDGLGLGLVRDMKRAGAGPPTISYRDGQGAVTHYWGDPPVVCNTAITSEVIVCACGRFLIERAVLP